MSAYQEKCLLMVVNDFFSKNHDFSNTEQLAKCLFGSDVFEWSHIQGFLVSMYRFVENE